MEERPRHRRGPRARRRSPVADDRMADRGQVHPDLVGPPGLQPAARAARGRPVGRSGPGPRSGCGPSRPPATTAMPGRVARRAPDRARRSTPRGRLGHAPHQGHVAPRRPGASASGRDERGVGGRRAGHHQEPGRVPVEAVDDARPVGLSDVGELGVAGQETVDQRARRSARRPGAPPARRGLSTTTTSASSYTTSTGTLGVRLTARTSRAARRRRRSSDLALAHPLLAGGRPSSRRGATAPAATSAAASLRLHSAERGDDPIDPLPVERGGDRPRRRLAHSVWSTG